MAHDVFISHSSNDKPIADAICATLEQNGIRCWIAPRDIIPGADWSESIIRAISGSRVFVLIFSHFANASEQIKREVALAVNRGLPVIPYRIEDIPPNDSLEYFISTPHWLDAFTPPAERHAQYLADTIKRLLGETRDAPPAPPSKPAPKTSSFSVFLRPAPLAGLAVVAVLLVGAALYGLQPPSFVGRWVSTKIDWNPGVASNFNGVTLGELFGPAMTGPNTTASFTVNPSGGFQTIFTTADQGTVVRKGSELVFTSQDGATSRVEAALLTPRQNTALGVPTGQSGLGLLTPGRGGLPWAGSLDFSNPFAPLAGFAGAWRSIGWTPLPTGQVWSGELSITPTGAYKLQLTATTGGTWAAANGSWKASASTPTPSPASVDSGTYRFQGHDQLMTTDPVGTTTWKRVG